MVLLGSVLIISVFVLGFMLYAEFSVGTYDIIVGVIVILISIGLIVIDNMAQKETTVTTTKVYTDNINNVYFDDSVFVIIETSETKATNKMFLTGQEITTKYKVLK